jgi:hypothetical protein
MCVCWAGSCLYILKYFIYKISDSLEFLDIEYIGNVLRALLSLLINGLEYLIVKLLVTSFYIEYNDLVSLTNRGFGLFLRRLEG